MLTLAWWLIVGHFLCDYVFQNETMALNKRRVLHVRDLQSTPVRNVPWYYWMIARGLTHGAWVAAATGKPYLGAAEAITHIFIDTVKCEGFIDHKLDQAMHLFCKLAWLVIANMEV